MACLRMPIVSFVVILAFLCPLRVLTDNTEYSLLEPNRRRPIVAAIGYSVDLNCQLTDPNVDVLLIQEKAVTGQTKTIDLERTPDGVRVTQSGQIFTINNVEPSDKGTYHCKAQLTSIKIEKLIPVYGSKENYISSHSILPRNNSVSEGASATFSCNVTGKGIKNVEWFKDKMRLPSTSYQSGKSYISDLKLTAVTVSDAGAFECRATVVLPPFKGYQGKTGMLFLKEFHFLAKKRPYQRLFVGDPVTINCKTNDQNAMASSLWVRKDTNPAQEIVPNGGSITRRGNRFYFSSIALDNAGLYTCEATLPIINKTIEKEVTSLLVFTGDNRNPQAQVYPLVKEALGGQDYNFSCQVPGDDISIKWLKDGVDIPSYQRHRQPNTMIRGFNFNEDILMLKKVSRVDVGNYTCVVTTSKNKGYSSNVTARLLSVKECLDPDNSEKFADPTDVHGYYECIQGVPLKRNCPATFKWNQVENICKHPLSWLVDHDSGTLHLIPGVALLLDCRLDDSNVLVEIYRRRLYVDLSSFERVYPRTDKFVKQNGQNFTIAGLPSNHKFEFECRTTEEAGTPILKKKVTIERAQDFRQNVFVETIPSCSRGPLDVTDSINIICHGLHFGGIKWFKLGQEITDSRVVKGVSKRIGRTGHYERNSTLMLQNVTRSDAGSYVCSKSNGHNRTANVTVFIDVAAPSPARVSGQMQSPQAVNEGSNARFLCTVSGSPRPTVKWLKGTEIVAVCEGKQHGTCRIVATDRSKYRSEWRDERACMVQRSTGQTSGRWISWLNVLRTRSPADAVNYTCVVDNGAGKPDKQVALLEINVAPVLVKDSNTGLETPIVIKDKKEELNCTTKRGYPPANFSWQYQPFDCTGSCSPGPFKNRKWKPISSDIGQVDRRSPKTSILIVPPNIDKMYFRCTAVNPVTRAKDSIVYKFLRREKVVSFDDLVVKPADSFAKNEGDNITLRCEASLGVFKGLPSWTKDKKTLKIAHGRMNVKQWSDKKSISELHIQNATSEDAGLYECNAVKDIDGRGYQKSIRLTIKKLTKPTVIITPNVTTTKGQRTELFCNVTSNPQPKEVIWTRNGQIVTPTRTKVNDCEQLVSDFYEVEDGTDSSDGVWRLLLCSPSDAQQTGSYKCLATNIKGSGSATTYLNILENPKASVTAFQNGSTLTLTCNATGNPVPVVYWEKDNADGQFVPLEGSGEKRHLGHNVIEAELSEDTYGTTYRCVANNTLGYDFFDHLLQDPNVGEYAGNPPDNKAFSKVAMIVVVSCSSFFILLLLFIIFVLYRRKKRYGGFFIFTLPPSPDYIMTLDPERSLLEQINKLPYDAQWEFPRERLSVVRPLGSGAFGQVFLAQATGIVAFDPRGSMKRKSGRRRSRFGSTSRPYYNDKRVTAVAVKSLKESATEAEYRDLVSELKILIHIGEHKNIVNLLGACTKGRERDLWVIIEYCPHGNLLDFLRKRREIFEATWTTPTEHADETFTTIDLYICALQVARAMEFLASRRCVHRDLAARNVLVGEDYVLKVADFGLARDIYKDEHYVKTTSGLLPVKWMAIEALVDRVYTHKSDVWSFGVLLWELFTLGGSPYPGLPANEVYQYLMEGNRMEQPVDCPDEMYEIMCQSWMHSPEDRPSFTDVAARLDKLLDDKTTETGEGYLDLEHGEDDPNLDEPIFDDEYLDPGESLLPPPGSPTSEDERHAPLPPLPLTVEEIELETFAENPEEEEKQKFILRDPPKEKRVLRMDSELEKARKDTLEKEKARESIDQHNNDDFISEKEQLRSDDEDRDICERNSGIFEYPPDYNHKPGQNLLLVPLPGNGYCREKHPPQGDVDFKTGKTGSLGRQPSNRYVKS